MVFGRKSALKKIVKSKESIVMFPTLKRMKVPFTKGKQERNFVQMLHEIAGHLMNANKQLLIIHNISES